MIRPASSRRAVNTCGLGAASRNACTGATLVARYAGASAAASVVTSPMTHARVTWSSGTDRPVMGSDSPNVPRSAARPRDTPMPSSAPASTPATPTAAASASTEPNT